MTLSFKPKSNRTVYSARPSNYQKDSSSSLQTRETPLAMERFAQFTRESSHPNYLEYLEPRQNPKELREEAPGAR